MNKEYLEYLTTQEWNQIKEDYYSTNKKVCSICKSAYRIQLHHLTYKLMKDKETQRSFLIPLCSAHHTSVHSRSFNPKGIGDPTRNSVYLSKEEFMQCFSFVNGLIEWNYWRYKNFKRLATNKHCFTKSSIKQRVRRQRKKQPKSIDTLVSNLFDKIGTK